ncbi:MAG TPA: molybdenum cofactor biosynthesis protein MoaE [Actinomycetota bacterium]|nr:molybdenum cofactor biosynthesis protein MoaE [Actinomycetota bacterium]
MRKPDIEIDIQAEPIDLTPRKPPPTSGAVVTFAGYVRSATNEREVTGLDYEAFEEMVLAQLGQIANVAAEKWKLDFVRIVHRTGALGVGEPSVLVQVSSAHRDEAFEGCRSIIDTLKSTAAIWKKENFSDGTSSWVNHP